MTAIELKGSRSTLMFAWRTFVVAFVLIGCMSFGAARAQASGNQDELVKTYLALGLPMPPADAPLVKITMTSVVNDVPERIEWLGFLLDNGSKDRPPTLLIGTEVVRERRNFSIVDPTQVNIDHVLVDWNETNACFATAIQCRSRGWIELADHLQAKSLGQDFGHPFSPFRQPPGLNAKTNLDYLAWAHWANEVMRTGSDRALIAKRMRELVRAERAFNDEAHLSLLQSLEAAIALSVSKPDTVDAMVDRLVDVTTASMDASKIDPNFAHVGMLGFAAVPTLIRHLDDKQLTHARIPAMNMYPGGFKHVGDIAAEILQELAGDDLSGLSLQQSFGSGVSFKQAALKWWQSASTQGEERYFASHVLPQNGKQDFPYLLMLRIIVDRYPGLLPELYTTVLEKRRDVMFWCLADTVGKSSLPDDIKLKLIRRGADDPDLENKRAALWVLKELDQREFVDRLVKTLDALPKTPTSEYWSCREASFAPLVRQTDDPRAWQALLSAAKRADVWLRMEYMNPMDYDCGLGNQYLQQRLNFLADFLDDSEAREIPKDGESDGMHGGPFAGFFFKRLEVRDLAAIEIGSLLGQDGLPTVDSKWNPQRWAAFRKRMKDALSNSRKTTAEDQPRNSIDPSR